MEFWFVRFSVEDTGIGIKKEYKNKLITKFGMIESTQNKEINP